MPIEFAEHIVEEMNRKREKFSDYKELFKQEGIEFEEWLHRRVKETENKSH
ncbi:MAG: hypothetical protein IKA36_01670 [Clostridia bacterium]|nr:hypothetical protein [Clostridia bacterium]